MTHQIALTVIAKIKPGETSNLKSLLGNIRKNRQQTSAMEFEKVPNIHFARLFIIDEVKDPVGSIIPASLVCLTDADAPLDRHLEDLATITATDLDKIFSYCEGYPAPQARTPASRIAFLRSHSTDSQPFYVNTPSRTVLQIRQEDRLRQAISAFLDSRDWSHRSVMEVRSAIQDFVRSQPDLNWAQSPPDPPELSWQAKELLHTLGMPLLVLLLLPLIALALPIGLILLRIHEERDIPDTSKANPDTVEKLRADEDFGVQNQIIAIGFLKPGLFRQITSILVIFLADYLIRHIYNRGSLSGLNTIHFARWVSMDRRRRLFFVSNYDGSLESYMNDFIDKAYWGLNAIFTSGDGFPKTRWLFFGGIQDEQAYKTFLPTRQIATQVWYSAYPHLSTVNIQNNALIRAGLFSLMGQAQAGEWLQKF
jgi:hypothetical protein